MKMRRPRPNITNLWDTTRKLGNLRRRHLWALNDCVSLAELCSGSSIGNGLESTRGRSVFVLTRNQISAALALLELDGVARRIVLYPPDLPAEHISDAISAASADVVVCDSKASIPECAGVEVVPISSKVNLPVVRRAAEERTEWVLFTSGTTGRPKMAVHTFFTLTDAIVPHSALETPPLWSTFYDIRRYGGLQIFLRAMLSEGSMVFSDSEEATADFLSRTGDLGVTHISGTPSHWRRALMCRSCNNFKPQYVRLSGEIADQSTLDNLRQAFPAAQIAHAFAATEAGVAFDVRDNFAGFPAKLMSGSEKNVIMKVVDGSLRIRSNRAAHRYLGDNATPLRDLDGFVDTGDLVELRDGRYYFVGRRDGVINVGGFKVHPEEVEAVIQLHQSVCMCRVKGRKSPFTGAVVVAEVVIAQPSNSDQPDLEQLKSEILEICARRLSRHKVPAAIHFVPKLAINASGKLGR